MMDDEEAERLMKIIDVGFDDEEENAIVLERLTDDQIELLKEKKMKEFKTSLTKKQGSEIGIAIVVHRFTIVHQLRERIADLEDRVSVLEAKDVS